MLSISSYSAVDDAEFLDFYQSVKIKLPQELLKKTEAFKHPVDQQRSLIGNLIVRLFYAELFETSWGKFRFSFNEHEKPFLEGMNNQCFNISHSGNQVVVAFSNQALGIDVEKVKGDRRKIAQRFFTPEEIQDMNAAGSPEKQVEWFYRLWTLKESYMKAIGGGMSLSLSAFAFKKEKTKFQLAYSAYDTDWRFITPNWEDGYFLSICAKTHTLASYKTMSLNDIANRIL